MKLSSIGLSAGLGCVLSVLSMAIVSMPAVLAEVSSKPARVPFLLSNTLAAEALSTDERALPLELTINTHIPARQHSSQVSPIEHEVMFDGNANEIIVVYWASEGPSASAQVELYHSSGEQVSQSHRYAYDIELSESDGRHGAFLLPQTGTYRLVFKVGGRRFSVPRTSLGSPPIPIPAHEVEHVLRLRVASYYERLMLSAHEYIEQENFDEALSLFTLAAEHRSDLPQPYLGRVFVYAEKAFATLEGNPSVLDAMSLAFQSLESDEQLLVIFDLRRAAENYAAVIASGITTLDDFEPEFLSHIADYLETGIASSYLVEALEGW